MSAGLDPVPLPRWLCCDCGTALGRRPADGSCVACGTAQELKDFRAGAEGFRPEERAHTRIYVFAVAAAAAKDGRTRTEAAARLKLLILDELAGPDGRDGS